MLLILAKSYVEMLEPCPLVYPDTYLVLCCVKGTKTAGKMTMTILADFTVSSEDIPPYRQVRRAIAQDIREGTIAVGTKLPTVRSLAAQLNLATNTVARAYKELEELGLVEGRGRAGTIVTPGAGRTSARIASNATWFARSAEGAGLSLQAALDLVRAAWPSNK